MCHADRQSGFTLLELLLALSLTAMLLTLLSAGTFEVMRDWDNNHEGLDRTLDQTVAMLQIERALQGATPHSYRNVDTMGREIFFRGSEDDLSWVSTVSPQRGTGLTTWRLHNDSDGGVHLQLAPALSDDPGPLLDEARQRLLLPGYRATFSYLFEEGDEDRIWRDTWDGAERLGLPLAVHVRLTPLEDSSRETGLDIVAPIPAHTHRTINPNPLVGP